MVTTPDELRKKKERTDESLSRANQDAFESLAAAIRLGKVIAVVGAGVSIRLGYPSWSKLLTMLGEEVLRLDPGLSSNVKQLSLISDLPWRAERFRSLMGEDRYVDFIRKVFRPIPNSVSDDTVKNLIRIPFSHFMTTNYDEGLEQGHIDVAREDPHFPRPLPPRVVDWMNPSDVREFMYELRDPGYARRYVYLHGRYNNPASIILTDRDYTERYLRSTESSKKLFGLLSTQTLVFIGYSMTDPAIQNLLREVKINMGIGGPRHFAVLGLNAAEQNEAIQRSRLSGSFGVEPIFYPYTEDHSGLSELVTLLHGSTALAGAPLDVTEAMRAMRAPSSAMFDPDDPQKNRFGGVDRRDGFALTATVARLRDQSSEKVSLADGRRLFEINLTVFRTAPNLTGVVRFHLHPTFVPPVRDVVSEDGSATLRLVSWGAFTVGVELLDHNITLELDLSTLTSAPNDFRSS